MLWSAAMPTRQEIRGNTTDMEEAHQKFDPTLMGGRGHAGDAIEKKTNHQRTYTQHISHTAGNSDCRHSCTNRLIVLLPNEIFLIFKTPHNLSRSKNRSQNKGENHLLQQ